MITGSSSGLGFALSELLYNCDQYRVAITARKFSQVKLRERFVEKDNFKIFDLDRETRIIRKEVGTEGTICYTQLTPQLLTKWAEYIVK